MGIKEVPDLKSDSDGTDQNQAAGERRRVPRLMLPAEQFRHGQTGKIFPVVNLSIGGMGIRILDSADQVLFAVGMEFAGTLNLQREKYPVKLRVQHAKSGMAGCRFTELDPRLSVALFRISDPATLGPELRPFPAPLTGAQAFHGPLGTELLLWRGIDGGFKRLLLIHMGLFVQLEEGQSFATTGYCTEKMDPSMSVGVLRYDTLLLNADDELDPAKVDVANSLVMSSNLSSEAKKWAEHRFKRG